MAAYFLVLFALPVLLIAAAACDLARYTIPNSLQAALILSFISFGLTAHLSMATIALHLAAGLAGFVIGFALFAPGFIGGGDAKLFAVSALWLGLHDLAAYALMASIFGGILTLAILLLRRFPLPRRLLGHPWILRLHDPKAGIPYGVALAGGVAAILPHSEIFRLAVKT